MHLVTVTQVLTQLGRTPGADGEAAGGAEDEATTEGGVEDETTAGGAAELPCWTGAEDAGAEDAGGAAELDATGATHFVQMVEIEVLVTVDTVVETCWIGVPWGGVMVLVTGHVVKV